MDDVPALASTAFGSRGASLQGDRLADTHRSGGRWADERDLAGRLVLRIGPIVTSSASRQRRPPDRGDAAALEADLDADAAERATDEGMPARRAGTGTAELDPRTPEPSWGDAFENRDGEHDLGG